MAIQTPYEIQGRRYDLDWLRVLAFGILILYHVAMFYVADWGWHIKNETTHETLQYLMLLVNPWRMPLLFLISGAAMWFAAKKISAAGLLKLRTIRLLPPLVLGMLVIVPPQMYFQILQAEGIDLGYGAFYRIYLDMGTDQFPNHQTPAGLMTWNHLWFIPYLLSYTLVFVVVKPLLDHVARWVNRFDGSLAWVYLLPLTTLLFYGYFIEPRFPKNHALVGDWAAHALYGFMFASGYVLAGQLQIVRKLVSARWFCLSLSLLTYVLLILVFRGELFTGPDGADRFGRMVVYFLNGWGWLLTVMAWGAAFLNRPSRALTYMNEAILPWYVLHQSVTIVLAWYLTPLGLGDGIEATLLVIATVAGCALGYEIIRRFTLTRFLFGLKLKSSRHAAGNKDKPSAILATNG